MCIRDRLYVDVPICINFNNTMLHCTCCRVLHINPCSPSCCVQLCSLCNESPTMFLLRWLLEVSHAIHNWRCLPEADQYFSATTTFPTCPLSTSVIYLLPVLWSRLVRPVTVPGRCTVIRTPTSRHYFTAHCDCLLGTGVSANQLDKSLLIHWITLWKYVLKICSKSSVYSLHKWLAKVTDIIAGLFVLQKTQQPTSMTTV